jgi:hypothetical protein
VAVQVFYQVRQVVVELAVVVLDRQVLWAVLVEAIQEEAVVVLGQAVLAAQAVLAS